MGRRGEAVNVVSWFHFATLDIIEDFGLGEPFGCLEKGGSQDTLSLFSQLRGDCLRSGK